MKRVGAKVIIFIASMIVGVLIALNFNIEGKRGTQLDAKEYQNAIEERNILYKEIANLNDINYETNSRINEYLNSDETEEKIIQSMREQLADYSMVTGQSEVKGPGIIIKITDGVIDYNTDTTDQVARKIFHDSDMSLLINQIRTAGAEAIALNDYRIRPSFGVVCGWAFLRFEDDVMEYAPFSIYAIGDPEVLKSQMLEEGSHLRTLMIRGLNIEIETSEEIVMPAATPFEFKYAEEYIKKD